MRGSGSAAERPGTAGTGIVRRADLLPAGLLVAFITLLFADVLLGINGLYLRDISLYYHPAKSVLRDIVLGGDFPSWNPWFSAGQPLAANPEHEVFYPLTWLILLPSFEVGFALLIVAHLYIAALGMYAFVRSLGAGRTAAFFGALSFVFGGIGLSYLNLLPCLFSVAWLPLICLYARRFLREGGRRDFALASVFFGLQLLVGEPSTILQTGLLLGIYALARPDRGRAVSRVAVVTAAALLLSAVQMLPAIDHARQSVRARGFPFERVTSWSTPPARVVELVQPNAFGHQSIDGKRVYWAGALYPGRGVPFLYSVYSGLAVTILVLAGLFANARGRKLTLALFGLSALLALGAHTPLWRWLYDLGLARSIRYPEKFLLIGAFAAIVYASIVLEDLLRGGRARRPALIVTGVLAVSTALVAAFAFTPAHAPAFIALWKPPARMLTEMLALSRSGWTLAFARALLLFVLIRNLGRIRERTWVVLFTLFVLLDLSLLYPELAPRVPSEFYRQPPALAQELPPERAPYRLFHIAAWQLGSAGWYTTPRRDAYWVHRNALYPPMTAGWRIRTAVDVDYDLTALQPTADFATAVWTIARTRPDWLQAVAAMSNTWYAAVFVPGEEAFARARENARLVQPVRLIPLERHPRYFFAERVESVSDFAAKVSSARFPDRTAFVDGTRFDPAPGRVTHFTETANTARIDVETAGRAFLVMSVTPQRYWRVTIDGKPARSVVTNVGFQGVVVEKAGRHVVDMRYRNPLFAIGGAISLLTLAGLLWRMR